MKSFHERLAELHMKPNRTAEETMEFHICLLRNTEYVNSMKNLEMHKPPPPSNDYARNSGD